MNRDFNNVKDRIIEYRDYNAQINRFSENFQIQECQNFNRTLNYTSSLIQTIPASPVRSILRIINYISNSTLYPVEKGTYLTYIFPINIPQNITLSSIFINTSDNPLGQLIVSNVSFDTTNQLLTVTLSNNTTNNIIINVGNYKLILEIIYISN